MQVEVEKMFGVMDLRPVIEDWWPLAASINN